MFISFSLFNFKINKKIEKNFTLVLKTVVEINIEHFWTEEKLTQAKTQLELAKKKAKDIREEGLLRATQEVNNCVSQHEERLSKLEEFKQETIQF